MFESVKELVDYRCMLDSLVKREIRGRYKGSLLGFLWNFVTPLIQILVYIAVFTIVFRIEIDNYPIYLISGMVPWIFFAESLGAGSGTIVLNSNMVNKIYFPRSILPISIVMSKLVNFIISIAIALVIVIVTGYGVSLTALLIVPIAVLLITAFSIGLTMLLSAANAYLRDIEYVTNVMLMVVIWLTPVMYLRTQFDSPLFDTILALNPMTYFVELFQDILYWQIVPSLSSILTCVLIAGAMLIIGWLGFMHMEKDFAEVI